MRFARNGPAFRHWPTRDATFVVLVNASSNFENTADIIASSLIKDLFPEVPAIGRRRFRTDRRRCLQNQRTFCLQVVVVVGRGE